MATTHTDTGRLRRIEGRHNALVKELRQAFDRGELTPAGECAVEGFRIIEEAVRSGLRFRAIFFSELAQARTSRLLPQIGAHVETLLLPDKLFRSAVPSETPQGVAALVTVKKFSTTPPPGPCWSLPECKTPETWGRFCGQPRPLAQKASFSATAQSAPITAKWFALPRDRFSE